MGVLHPCPRDASCMPLPSAPSSIPTPDLWHAWALCMLAKPLCHQEPRLRVPIVRKGGSPPCLPHFDDLGGMQLTNVNLRQLVIPGNGVAHCSTSSALPSCKLF
eukprot:1153929-Pelagomonas_calceolata.AAC.6